MHRFVRVAVAGVLPLVACTASPATPSAQQTAPRPPASLAGGLAPAGQGISAAVLNAPSVQRALAILQRDNEWTLSQQVSICEIPAPPFREAARAAEFARRLRALGLRNVRIDSVGNVIAERPGQAARPLLVFAAHLDTVFPEGTNVRVRRSADTLRAPGISDNCRGLAVLLAVARAMREAAVRTGGTVLFVGTVGEEGAGNLRGVRHLFAGDLGQRVDYFVTVDGSGLDMSTVAVGSNRYRVVFHGPGGHSFGAFGMPNPTHALGRAIARISDIHVPRSPKTTFNVGVVAGGTSVNSISAASTMDVDLRSESPRELVALDAAFRAAVATALADERARWPASAESLHVRIDTIGIRPAGTQPDTARIVRVARGAGRALGFEPRAEAGSTDANIPISLGIPAIQIDGGGRSRGAHSLAEMYIDGATGWRGPQWALLVVSELIGVR